MKKLVFVTIVISLILTLSACSSTQSATATASASNTLTMEGQLLVGTFKLENTSLAISSTQARALLPLWETLESLASSKTAASQEVDAVISQIQSSMDAAQISSITAMKLTQSDLAATAIDTGTASSTSSTASKASTSSSANGGGGPFQAGAGAPSGGNPPSDLGGVTGTTTGQTQSSTSQATSTQTIGTTSLVSVAMIKAVVELLQNKIG